MAAITQNGKWVTVGGKGAAEPLPPPPFSITLQQNGQAIVASGQRNLGGALATVAGTINLYAFAAGQTFAGHGITTINNVVDGPWTSNPFANNWGPGPWTVEVHTVVNGVTYIATSQITLLATPPAPPPTGGGTTGGGTTGGGTTPPPPATGLAPPPPAAAGVVAQFDVQNNGTAVIPARVIRTARPFVQGALPATLAGVQVDALANHTGGSVKLGGIALHVPDIAPGTAYRATLAAGTAAAGNPVATAAVPLVVTLSIKSANSAAISPPEVHILDFSAEIAASTDYWLHGPLATQVRARQSVKNALSVVVDTTFYADGRVENDIQLRNTWAMGATGGDITFDLTVTYGGVIRLQHTDLTALWQYQMPHFVVWAADEPAYNVAHPPADLLATPAFYEYDLVAGADPSNIPVTPAGGFGWLNPGPYPVYMGQTGVPTDIGPDPEWAAAWLLTQTEAGRDYALACSDCTGSIPWYMEDVTTGDFMSVVTRPGLWADSRQAAAQGGLTQGIPQKYSYYDASHNVVVVEMSGWNVDAAHQPSGNYVAYCLTGDRYRHDLMVGQASWNVMSMNPQNGYRNGVSGIVVTNATQTRAVGWSLRELVRVAFASKSHGAEYSTLVDNNLSYLLAQANGAGKSQGEAGWWIQGQYGIPEQIAPWQQDYGAASFIQADRMGFTKATQLLMAQAGFIAGRFLPQAGGWQPVNGIVYNMQAMSDSQFTPIMTWAAIQAATGMRSGSGPAPNGWTALDGTPWPPNTFLQYYLMALSNLRYLAKHLGAAEPRFIQARDWFAANTAAFCTPLAFSLNPAYSFAA